MNVFWTHEHFILFVKINCDNFSKMVSISKFYIFFKHGKSEHFLKHKENLKFVSIFGQLFFRKFWTFFKTWTEFESPEQFLNRREQIRNSEQFFIKWTKFEIDEQILNVVNNFWNRWKNSEFDEHFLNLMNKFWILTNIF